MKNLLILIVAMLSVSALHAQAKDQADLPAKIQEYLKQSFPDHKVLRVEKDKDDKDPDYEIYLDKDIVLDFDKDNNIESIDARAKLPDTAIPPQILSYVKTKYPTAAIYDWEMDDNNQEITLDNGTELKFSKEGAFISAKKSD